MGAKHKRETNSPRDHPLLKNDFYDVIDQEDGTVTIYLKHEIIPATTEDGATDYDIRIHAIRGIVPWWKEIAELEDDIRQRYSDYLDSAEVIYL